MKQLSSEAFPENNDTTKLTDFKTVTFYFDMQLVKYF